MIEVHLDLGGLPATLLDTAGIRDTEDPLEREGVKRARQRAADADLVLWVVDAADLGRPMAESPAGGVIGAAQSASRREDSASGGPRIGTVSGKGPAAPSQALPHPPVWLVINKIDLIGQSLNKNELVSNDNDKSETEFQLNKSLRDMVNQPLKHNNELKHQTNGLLTKMVNAPLNVKNEPSFLKSDTQFSLSATSGEGFEPLLAGLTRFADDFLAGAESALVTRQRHRHTLEEALEALRRGAGTARHEDLLAEELRLAARALGRLTGRVDVEDILDVIFRDFCIGK